MSYDVYMSVDTGVGNSLNGESQNYTYNVGGMFSQAMGVGLGDLHGMRASDAKFILQKGIYEMRQNPDVYKEMNPANGWGDYETAVLFLEWIYTQCEQHPLATVKVV